MLNTEFILWLGSCQLVLETVSCLVSISAWANYVTSTIKEKALYSENLYQGSCKLRYVSVYELKKKVPLPPGRNSHSWFNECYRGWTVKGRGSLNKTKHNWGIVIKRRRRDAVCIYCHWKWGLSVLTLYMICSPSQSGIPHAAHNPYKYMRQLWRSQHKYYSEPKCLKCSKHQIGGYDASAKIKRQQK